MRRDHAPIVAVDLRNTQDPRSSAAVEAWLKIEQKFAQARAWLAEIEDDEVTPDLYFGGAAKS